MDYTKLNNGSASGALGYAATGNDAASFLKADCGVPKYISSVTIGYDYLNNAAGGWGTSYTEGRRLEASLDNSNWTIIGTVPTYNSTTAPNGLYTFQIGQVYRYIRLTNSGAGGYVAATEFSISGGAITFDPSFVLTADARSNPERATANAAFSTALTADAVSPKTRIVTTFTQSGIYSGNVAATYASMNNNSAATGYTATSSANPSWVQADCGSVYNIKNVLFGYDYLNVVPGGWGTEYGQGLSIQGSLDATNWTTITTTPPYSSTGSTDGLVRININSKYRYLRLYNTSYFVVTEFSLWGTPAGGSSFFAMF